MRMLAVGSRPVLRRVLGSHGSVASFLLAELMSYPSVLMSGVFVVLWCFAGACRCLILAPTRELAKQVAAEFESICPSLTVVSFYGGTSINAQVRNTQQRGVSRAASTAADTPVRPCCSNECAWARLGAVPRVVHMLCSACCVGACCAHAVSAP